MQDRRVSTRYALAIFNSASKADAVHAVEKDLAAIVATLETNASFHDFLKNPTQMREQKLALVDKLFSDRVTALSLHLLRLMLNKGREELFTMVYEDFIELRRKQQGVARAIVASAEEMPTDQRAAITAKLEKLTGKKVETAFTVDPSLIGGVRVTYDNYALDGSIQGAMRTLRERLNAPALIEA